MALAARGLRRWVVWCLDGFMLGIGTLGVIALHAPVCVQGAALAATGHCGDGIIKAGETCDDGGTCVGGADAGETCTADAHCANRGVCIGGTHAEWACGSDAACPDGECVRCRPFGGDGCAANCTMESGLPFPLVSGLVSGTDLARGSGVRLLFSESGTVVGAPFWYDYSLPLAIGRADSAGTVPIVVRPALRFPQALMGLHAGVCMRLVALKTCGGTLFDSQGESARDCTDDATVCAADTACAFAHGPGNAGAGAIGCTLQEAPTTCAVDGCFYDPGLCPDPSASIRSSDRRRVEATGHASVRVSQSYRLRHFPPVTFCTDAESPAEHGAVFTTTYVTGTATALLCGAHGYSDWNLGPLSDDGHPFRCLATHVPDSAGACLVSASTTRTDALVGDVATTSRFCTGDVAQPTPCAGDCNGDRSVTIDEILVSVNIAMGSAPLGECEAARCEGVVAGLPEIAIDCIIKMVGHAIMGCPFPVRRCSEGTGAHCPDGEVCEEPDCYSPNRAAACVPAEGPCPVDSLPVCGCDRRTYRDDCARRAAGVGFLHAGPCVTSACRVDASYSELPSCDCLPPGMNCSAPPCLPCPQGRSGNG